jgi:hypothetical protein
MVDANWQYRDLFIKHGEPIFEKFSLASREIVIKFARVFRNVRINIRNFFRNHRCSGRDLNPGSATRKYRMRVT